MRVIDSSACLCTADAVRPTVLLLCEYRQLHYIRPDKLLISILHSAESPAASWALCCSCELFVLCLSSHLPLPVSSCLPSPPFHPPLTSSDLLPSFHFPLTLSASLLLSTPTLSFSVHLPASSPYPYVQPVPFGALDELSVVQQKPRGMSGAQRKQGRRNVPVSCIAVAERVKRFATHFAAP